MQAPESSPTHSSSKVKLPPTKKHFPPSGYPPSLLFIRLATDYLVTCLRVLGFLEATRRNPREVSRQILLSLCLSTREAAQRKGRCSELAWGLALLVCFYKLGTKLADVKGLALLKKVGPWDFPFQDQATSFSRFFPWQRCAHLCFGDKMAERSYRSPRKVLQQLSLD